MNSAAPVQPGDAPQITLPAPTAAPSASPAYPAVPVPGNYPQAQANTRAVVSTGAVSPTRGMYTAAAIINWVVLGLAIAATAGIGVIFAAWFVPMTIRMHKNAKAPYKHTSLGVCTLLFCNLISGILLLVDDNGRPPKPRV